MIGDAGETTVVAATAIESPEPNPPRRWVRVSGGRRPPVIEPPLRARQIYLQVVIMAVAVIIAVGVLGAVASRKVAEREAVNDAAQTTGVLADAVVQPVLTPGVVTGDKAAIARLDRAVRDHVLGDSILRVKVWTVDGRIVYSDESRLIGQTFPLGEDEQEVLAQPATRAEVSNLDEPENVYERGQGRLLEVYRPVWTSDGQVLFETYGPYSQVTSRTVDLWRGFAGVTFSSLLILVVLLLPVLWRLLDRLRSAQSQRETLLQRAIDASSEERQRIAATLHDGVVQELAATSFVVAGAAEKAEQRGDRTLADSLRIAAGTVRTSIGGLRSLLVDIYPPSLADTGLKPAIDDLVSGLRSRDIDVRLQVADDFPGVDPDSARLIFRVAQELLRNVVKHAKASVVEVSLAQDGSTIQLDIADDGIGFEPEKLLTARGSGHFGLRLLRDAVATADAQLSVASTPGGGTHWRLQVRPPVSGRQT